MSSIIDKFYENNLNLIEYLDEVKQPSFRIEAELNFKKCLLLSVASLFENEITSILINFVTEKSQSNNLVISFFKNKAIERQYHNLFGWKGRNANSFFALFGSDFKTKMVERVLNEDKLENAIKSFLELGHLRNQLVHKNFVTFPIDKTAEEIYDKFHEAEYFISELREELKNG